MNENDEVMQKNQSISKNMIIIIVSIAIVLLGSAFLYFSTSNTKRVSLISAQNYIVTINSITFYYNSTPMEQKIVDGIYDVSELNVETLNNPTSGYVTIKEGKVVEASLQFEKVINYENEVYTTVSKLKDTPNKNIPSKEIESFCQVTTASSNRAISKGDKYTCDPGDGKTRTFYVLEVTDNDVSLIMDRNLGSNVAWCNANGSNPYDKACNGDGAYEALKTRTANWKNVTVELPTINQIIGINNISFSFDNYPFLYNSGSNKTYCNTTDSNCVELVGGERNENTYGYWLKDSSWLGANTAFEVEFDNHTIFYTEVGNASRLGIRPVIIVKRI